jgi:hypothetical protein
MSSKFRLTYSPCQQTSLCCRTQECGVRDVYEPLIQDPNLKQVQNNFVESNITFPFGTGIVIN